MKKTSKTFYIQKFPPILPLVLLLLFFSIVQAQTTAFNFQGRLNDGTSPANGKYDLEFRLYDSITGGTLNGTNIRLNTNLINGVFSTQLDFGANIFNGNARYIEIRLRPAGSEIGYVILGPRQQILSVPDAVRSLTASNADNAQNAQNAANATNAQNAVDSQKLGGVAASQYVQQDVNGNISVTGNLTQTVSGRGLPKVSMYLSRDGNIVNCYNGITGASTNGCGFTVTHTALGVYEIHTGAFGINSSPVIVTTDFDVSDTVGTVVRHGSFIEVKVHYINNGDLTNAALSVVIY